MASSVRTGRRSSRLDRVLVPTWGAVLVVALGLPLDVARADAAQDCRYGSPEMRVAGCTRLLAEARTARQRAIALDGRCYAHNDRFAYVEAITDCTSAIRADDEYPYSFSNRGMAQAGLANYASAISDFTRAHALRPTLPWILVNRARAYTNLNNTMAAISDYEQALRLKPDNEDWKTSLATLRSVSSGTLEVANSLCGTDGCR